MYNEGDDAPYREFLVLADLDGGEVVLVPVDHVHRHGQALQGVADLMQLFALADGPAEYADIHAVRVFRAGNLGKKESLFYDLAQIRGGAAKDPALQGGDVVEVGEDTLKLVWKNITEAVRFNAYTSIPIK